METAVLFVFCLVSCPKCANMLTTRVVLPFRYRKLKCLQLSIKLFAVCLVCYAIAWTSSSSDKRILQTKVFEVYMYILRDLYSSVY